MITETLYDLTEELKLLVEDMEAWAEENDGDISEYPLDRIEKLEGDIKSKVLKCAALYKEWKAQGEIIKAEETALQKRRKAHENRSTRIKAYVASCLPPNAKYEDSKSAVSWKKNPSSVELIAQVKDLPEMYLRRAEPEADKAELKARMMEYEIELKDQLGDPVFDTEGKPMKVKEMQVRWPKPVIEAETDDLPFIDEVKDPNEKDYILLARLVQGKSLLIK